MKEIGSIKWQWDMPNKVLCMPCLLYLAWQIWVEYLCQFTIFFTSLFLSADILVIGSYFSYPRGSIFVPDFICLISLSLFFWFQCRCNMTLFETIIEEVKKYPCLWNKSLDSYRNQNARDNAWKMVSGALNTPGNFHFVCWYFFFLQIV